VYPCLFPGKYSEPNYHHGRRGRRRGEKEGFFMHATGDLKLVGDDA
jgi:hypothetical protein